MSVASKESHFFSHIFPMRLEMGIEIFRGGWCCGLEESSKAHVLKA